MDFILRTAPIPNDGRHRWVYAMTATPQTVEVMTERYHRAGFDVAHVARTAQVLTVNGIAHAVYAALAENTVTSLTPAAASTPETIFAVAVEPVPEALERGLDLEEWIVDGQAHPFKIGKSTDKLRDNAYYTCEAFYSKGSASVVSIKDKLIGAGYDVAFWPGELDRQRVPDVKSVRFVLSTQANAPVIADLQKLLGADVLIVNMFPLSQSAWIGFKNMDPQRVDELIAMIASVGDTMRGITEGVIKLARDGIKPVSWLPTILKFAVPVAAVLGGLWLYRTFKSRRPQE